MATVSIPWLSTGSVTFDYNSQEFTMSAPRFNKYNNGWSMDLSWGGGTVSGIPLFAGVDLLANFAGSPLPNLSAFYTIDLSDDVRTIEGLVLYIKED